MTEIIIARLKQIEERLRRLGVARLYLYGSYARDEARPDSDIDVLVDFAADDAREHDLEGFFARYHVLEENFPGVEIGYSTRDGLEPLYRPHIEQSAVQVF
jgi:predicted nucleotidyltransferase